MSITWINPLGGDWTVGANWSSGIEPAGTDDVLIGGTGAFTITYPFGANRTIASLDLNDPSAVLAFPVGFGGTSTLKVLGTVTLDQGTLTLMPGLATISATAVVNNGASLNFSGGEIDTATWIGPLDLSADQGTISFGGSPIFETSGALQPGTVTVTGIAATLNFAGQSTVDNVSLKVGAPGTSAVISASHFVPVGHSVGTNADSLTFGPGTRIDVSLDAALQGATIVNQGTITVENGAFLTVGSLSQTSGVLNNSGAFTNTGSIQIGAFGTLELLGSATLPNLGAVSSAGGQLVIGVNQASGLSSVLDLSAGTLTLGTGGQYPTLVLAGVLENGTVINNGATSGESGTLIGVTWLGTLDINVRDFSDPLRSLPVLQNVTVVGLDGKSPGVINIHPLNGEAVTVVGTQTLANDIINLNDGAQINTIGKLTLGADTTLNTSGFAGLTGATLVSQGLINAGTNFSVSTTRFTNSGTLRPIGVGSDVTIAAPAFTNTGSVRAHTLSINAQQVTNSGELSIDQSGVLEFVQSVNNAGTLAFGDTNETIKLDALAGFGATIAGWGTTDQVELVPTGTYTFDATSTDSTLIIDLNGTQAATLAVGPGFTLSQFSLEQGTGSQPSFVHLPCYARGTRIATAEDEIAVEMLREGDLARLASGGTAPVRWIGRRQIDCLRHLYPELVWPVRVSAGAFGAERPRRDLLLSPDHAVFVEDALVPIRLLINGTTIRQEARADVEYFHIELDRHDIILAEGLPAESYLDTGDRARFDNGGEVVTLHLDFSARVWEMEGCAPLLLVGAKLARIRNRLNARAAARSSLSLPASAARRRPKSSPAALGGWA